MRQEGYIYRVAAFLMILFGSLGLGVSPSMAAPELHIDVNAKQHSESFGQIDVTGFNAEFLTALRQRKLDANAWNDMFKVQLYSDVTQVTPEQLPNVSGRYEILHSAVRFVPTFAPSAGLSYRVSLSFEGYPQKNEEFYLSPISSAKPLDSKVACVYPSAVAIPENTLRFYVHFTQPMRRGQVEKHIRLLDDFGKVIENAFIVGPLGELWDNQQRRLTLLLDPGRIKQGVAPNRVKGPALQQGSQVTLRIDKQLKNADGNALESDFTKTFEITSAIRDAVSPASWVVKSPSLETNHPLRVRFSRNLDSAMLLHSIRVYNAEGAEVEGEATVTEEETLWAYHPTVPWESEKYFIEVDTSLEDVSGNNVLGPMDAKFTSESQTGSTKVVIIPFNMHASEMPE